MEKHQVVIFPVWTSEDAYFLKMSKYQERLLKHIEEHPEFIEPESRRNEMIQNFLKEPLPDLSVSRTSFKWGFQLSLIKVMLFMFGLMHYQIILTGLGYHPDQNLQNFLINTGQQMFI